VARSFRRFLRSDVDPTAIPFLCSWIASWASIDARRSRAALSTASSMYSVERRSTISGFESALSLNSCACVSQR
jgi:hypothetical protein